MNTGDLVQIKAGRGPIMVFDSKKDDIGDSKVSCLWYNKPKGRFESVDLCETSLIQISSNVIPYGKLEIGDVVELTTGGSPYMVVEGGNSDQDTIYCMWWDEHSSMFVSEELSRHALTKVS